ncbi:LacI family DNA-binding transcriptional regulator [Trinickia caryophylli]|uniref:Transcriptional regulator, LacI family n=1 Tax=Trinickia caryophylli TaxID=28094 RepID=A0A1X7CJN3_TRICW|nr:LacI family DNA-binding transcriptional regulator [Trinickia caryophylli]PMS09098.1 LacI family transcriptional regulator [Trinickia caryophylli]TRX19975.1 LacI family transcriptional regulator [Trinickia caryophylli]WQE12686.1 LacI family DNA-binding transcriptional regulator [Trinickia caryophylli]SME97852.1 transcriptional regulator, LacI family [Trinickia caryophylli]GLU30392.1 ribose operon repressor [Trinickia caryophylli]
MLTIRDVAQRAGVSYTTVSHVLNNTRPVSEEKRARVMAAIAELNYVPSAPARSLKARSTSTIGLVVPNNTNPYFAEFARGIEGFLRRSGYCVFLCNSDNDVVTQRECLRVLYQNRIDGLIVASVDEDESVAEDLKAMRVPVVVFDRPIAGLDADLVQIDHEAGAMMATRHLLDLGHTRIGCIAGASGTAVSAIRVAGFKRAMAEHGVPVLPGAIVEGDFTCPGGYVAARTLFDTVAPTAVFASNDMMAIGALRAASERGLRVPADCSIVGFDDVEMSRYVHPALSTVGQTILRLGEAAAKMLLDRLSGTVTGPAQTCVIEPNLHMRESSAPAVARA